MAVIEIVSHCYAVELPHYAAALNYQLSSLVLHNRTGSEHKAIATVCFDSDDERTHRIVNHFIVREKLYINLLYLDVEELGRRCIGRNGAAKWSHADIVWFSDVDQVYRDGCLDKLAEMPWPDGASMIYPRTIKIHRDHATGDVATGLVGDEPRVLDVDPAEFIDKSYRTAIGGVQIVRGDFAREHGYLDGDADWQRPREDGKPFGDFRDDLAYRRFCKRHGEIVGVDLPGMFRIRHTRTTYQ